MHTTAGGFSTYHPPAYGYRGLRAYHAPVAVPYYHAGCYDCAGAVAAGAVVEVGGRRGGCQCQRAPCMRWASTTRDGAAGAVIVNQAGINYQVGGTWFRPYYGANGVYYTVVPAPY